MEWSLGAELWSEVLEWSGVKYGVAKFLLHLQIQFT